MRGAYLEARGHLALGQIGGLSPLLEFSRRGNDSRSAVRAMLLCERVAGLHGGVVAQPLEK